ncbi:MAG: amidohydrolase family protein [Thermoplasmata archaeon]|nr:amidohydrolase family protein [Thermoplasmata archaeon]
MSWIVEGAIVDVDGARPGYVRFQRGAVTEVGTLGTDSTRGRVRRIRGIVVPAPVNGHTHLGDAVSDREPPHAPIEEIVRAPDGYKFRLLADTPPGPKRRAMRAALGRMRAEGVAATLDFREEGLEGTRLLRAASRGTGVRTVIFGRPLRRPVDRTEVERLLDVADGVGISSALEEPERVRSLLASACRRRGKYYGLHASEVRRESPDSYLKPRPDLLVHLTFATRDDLEAVVEAGSTVAVCPRSNALFGRRPDLATFAKVGVPTMLGTDNAMFHAPSMLREVEFAYVTARLARRPVPPGFLVRAAYIEPWRFLGRPRWARVQAGGPGRPLVFRLPPEQPEYQLATRATEHLIVRPGPRDP